MTQTIAIRADGNSEIGFGHLVRTQALARQLEKRGAKVIFLSRDPENIKTYPVRAIGSGTGPDMEDQIVEGALKQYGADMLVIDSYAYDQDRLERMEELDLLTVYIDDLNRHAFNTDLVVNGNLYARHMDYRGRAQSLLGPEYLLLREDFAALPDREPRTQVKDILISFGGADVGNITPRFLGMLTEYNKFKSLCWHVVIGPAFKNAIEIEALVHDQQNIHIYHNPDMKDLMNKCDLCISAAGSTTYELAACGTPAILIVSADNQLKLAGEAQSQGIALNLGWYYDCSPEQLYATLEQLMNYDLRQRIAARGQCLIDGKGAARVADRLLAMLNKGGTYQFHRRDLSK